jgi:DNA-binding transcriptional regulator YhcF (GntR family)
MPEDAAGRRGTDAGGKAPGAEARERLRERVLRAAHRGELRTGDRLPGVREAARALGVSTWAAARAYRELEEEGVVQRRARSGVYLAALDELPAPPPGETARWLCDVLSQARQHLVRLPLLPDLIRRHTGAVALSCACVESDLDSRTALCAQMGRPFGLAPRPVAAGAVPSGDPGGVPDALRGADVWVTTPLHAPRLRAAARAWGKPLVVAALDAGVVAAVERRLEGGRGLTLACADPRFGERARALFGERLRVVVVAGGASAARELDPSEPLLLTTAARRRLGEARLHLLVPRFPAYSAECARALTEVVVGLNLRAADEAPPPG